MRSGVTQSTPTAHPLVKVEVDNQFFYNEGVGGDERIVKVHTDKRAWGGGYRD